MDTYNTTISLADKTTAAAVMRMIYSLRTEEIDGEAVRSGYSDGTIQVNIAPGDGSDEASFFLRSGDRVIIVDSTMGRDGYFGMDEDVREFERIDDAVWTAAHEWEHLAASDRKRRLFEVQIVGQDHGAELEDGEIVDDVRAVIARFDSELPGIIAEMEKEEEEDEE